ncbi:MAG: hypothetical protein ACREPR_11875, partial [Brasilonema sp.]
MKNKPFLPPDDLPSTEATHLDKILRSQLEHSTGRCFFEACDQITRALLSSCQWYITSDALEWWKSLSPGATQTNKSYCKRFSLSCYAYRQSLT